MTLHGNDLPSCDPVPVLRGNFELLDRPPDRRLGIRRLHLADVARDLANLCDLPVRNGLRLCRRKSATESRHSLARALFRTGATSIWGAIGRNGGGADTLWNLRSLCREHDQMVKERRRSHRALYLGASDRAASRRGYECAHSLGSFSLSRSRSSSLQRSSISAPETQALAPNSLISPESSSPPSRRACEPAPLAGAVFIGGLPVPAAVAAATGRRAPRSFA